MNGRMIIAAIRPRDLALKSVADDYSFHSPYSKSVFRNLDKVPKIGMKARFRSKVSGDMVKAACLSELLPSGEGFTVLSQVVSAACHSVTCR
jgi:hypothetical protein